MSVDVDFSFPQRFACEVLDELPGGPAQRRHFPGDEAAGHCWRTAKRA
jgi:hypothetical protein